MEENHYLLYRKFLSSTCSPGELTALFHLFGTADENILRKLITEVLLSGETAGAPGLHEAERLNIIRQQVKAEISRRRNRVRTLIFKISAAAAIIIAVSGGIIHWYQPGSHRIPREEQMASVIKSGQLQATLMLANGKKIILSRSMTANLGKLGHTIVNVNPATGVSYTKTATGEVLQNSVNHLSTARGEQSPYPLVLADGSKVWLNAASSITFPTQFNSKERVVSVTGEVYFEVAHRKTAPFRVISGHQEITVLGTHFNIKAYNDDQLISTTLLQGSVKVKDLTTGTSDLLIPGQQSRLNTASGHLAVSKANIEEVIAWKNGFFMFNDQKIPSIMKSISRWYDVDIVYNNFSNDHENFGGTFSRTSNLPDILSSLESLGHVRFKINQRKVIVSSPTP